MKKDNFLIKTESLPERCECCHRPFFERTTSLLCRECEVVILGQRTNIEVELIQQPVTNESAGLLRRITNDPEGELTTAINSHLSVSRDSLKKGKAAFVIGIGFYVVGSCLLTYYIYFLGFCALILSGIGISLILKYLRESERAHQIQRLMISEGSTKFYSDLLRKGLSLNEIIENYKKHV